MAAPCTAGTLAGLLAVAYSEGWLPGKPHYVSLEAIHADAETAAESECDWCGRFRMSLFVIHHPADVLAYRAIMHCPACHWAMDL